MTTGADRMPCCANVASALATDVSWFRVTCQRAPGAIQRARALVDPLRRAKTGGVDIQTGRVNGRVHGRERMRGWGLGDGKGEG